jgi:hypothetical protein
MPVLRSRRAAPLALILCLSTGCATVPRLRVGQTYVIVWGYTGTGPEVTALRELVTLDQIGRGGWVYGHAPGQDRVWAFQLNNALSLTPLPSHPEPVVEQYRSAR